MRSRCSSMRLAMRRRIVGLSRRAPSRASAAASRASDSTALRAGSGSCKTSQRVTASPKRVNTSVLAKYSARRPTARTARGSAVVRRARRLSVDEFFEARDAERDVLGRPPAVWNVLSVVCVRLADRLRSDAAAPLRARLAVSSRVRSSRAARGAPRRPCGALDAAGSRIAAAAESGRAPRSSIARAAAPAADTRGVRRLGCRRARRGDACRPDGGKQHACVNSVANTLVRVRSRRSDRRAPAASSMHARTALAADSRSRPAALRSTSARCMPSLPGSDDLAPRVRPCRRHTRDDPPWPCSCASARTRRRWSSGRVGEPLASANAVHERLRRREAERERIMRVPRAADSGSLRAKLGERAAALLGRDAPTFEALLASGESARC